MDIAQIAALLDPFLEQSLPLPVLDQISIYIDLLLRWNARINLTAIRRPEEIVTRHFGESFFLARHLFPSSSIPCHPERSRVIRKADGAAESKDPYSLQLSASHPPRVLDIGSGAGFPAFPIKLWAPHIPLTLVESNHKKAAFLREVARALTLTDINVISDRVEVLAARLDSPRAEIVTLRAVEHLETILPQAVTLLAHAGTLALLIGASQTAHLATLPTLKWRHPIPVPKSHARVLSIGVHI